MASLIQIRRGTLAEWQAANPVLSNGEITFVTDENKIKIGNGSSNWSSLPYLEAAIDADSVVLGQDTTGNYVEIIDSGSGISISGSGSESASVTITNTGVLSLLGTENEITVSASSGDITLSLPATINADTTGNAATATALETARTISLGGDLSGSASFDGTSNITITASVDSLSSVNSITGTENEITVSASVGDITLSLPETINANTTGSAATLTTSRTIELTGDVTGSASFNGAANASIAATIAPNSVELGSDTTGNYVATIAGTSDQVTVTGSGSENAAVTLGLPSTINVNTTGNAGTATKLATERAIALTGDVTGTANFDGSASAGISTTLANTAVSPASYGSASAVGTFTVDSKGRLTAASNTPIVIAQSAVTDLTTDLGNKANLASPTFTGTPAAPTAAVDTNTTQIATTAYVIGQGYLKSATASSTYAPLASPALTGTPTAPTAAAGTNTTRVATTAFVQNAVKTVTTNVQTASYTLAVSDAGKVVEMNVASANNLTVPLNSSVAIPVGSSIDIIQYGAGQTTIVADGGVTIRSKEGSLKLTGQYSGATLYKRGTDEWVVVGDLTS